MQDSKDTDNKDTRKKLMKWLAILYGGLVAAVFLALLNIAWTDTGDTPVAVSPEEGQVEKEHDVEIAAVLEAMEEHMPPVQQTDSIAITYMPSWQRNAAPAVSSDRPKIAIVIDDLGLDTEASFAFAEMVGPYTLSFLPYADDLPKQTSMVRRAGHELMVHMPMEPNSDDDPGPNALLTTLDDTEFARRIDWNLNQFPDYVGINNHMGSLMTEQPGPMVRLMVIMRQRGLLFLDSLTSPNSMAARAAVATGVPSLKRDVFLDNERDMAAISEQLAITERIARSKGYAIAIGHPYDETLKALAFWRAGLEKRGFTLVPLSQLVTEEALPVTRAAAPISGQPDPSR